MARACCPAGYSSGQIYFYNVPEWNSEENSLVKKSNTRKENSDAGGNLLSYIYKGTCKNFIEIGWRRHGAVDSKKKFPVKGISPMNGNLLKGEGGQNLLKYRSITCTNIRIGCRGARKHSYGKKSANFLSSLLLRIRFVEGIRMVKGYDGANNSTSYLLVSIVFRKLSLLFHRVTALVL